MTNLYTSIVGTLTTEGITASHVMKRIGEISAVDTFAAKRVADELEDLILQVSTRALTGVEEWPGCRGFDVIPEPIEPGLSGTTRLHLQLSDSRYRQVFHALSGDVCSVMTSASGERDAIHLFHDRLLSWQSFLHRHGPEGLSEQARCGLFGELLVLRDVLLIQIDSRTALRSWRGCKKAHQDFQFPDRALEVKTTRATIPDRILVSNVQQLDSQGMAHMFLTVAHLHENETTGETLPELVESLRSALPDDARDLLDSGLEEVGYSAAHLDLYLRTRYQPIGLKHFEIREGFPRLTCHQIPEGVKSVRYEIAIDACTPFMTDQDSLLHALQGSARTTGDD